MRKVVEGTRRINYQWESLAELGDWIVNTPRTWGNIKDAEGEQHKRMSWDLEAGYKGAVKMAREGWLEGAQALDAALAVLTPKDTAPDIVTDFYGHMPHVARYCAGAPDNMLRHSPKATVGGGRVLTLYIPVNANSGVRAQNMKNYGLGLAQYVNQLEQQGIRVELYGTFANDYWSGVKRMTFTWRIKHMDQPLDLAILAFCVGHPAMFRRIGFAVMERSEAKPDYSYGQSVPAKLTDMIDPPAGAYVLNGMVDANEIAQTPEAALQYIAAQIERALETPDAE